MSEKPTLQAPSAEGDDQLPVSGVVFVIIVSLVIFALGVVWANTAKVRRLDELHALHGQPDRLALVGQTKLGIVEQELFEKKHDAQDYRESRLARLNSYGWVDRAKGTIHIPIEQAMRQILSEQKR
jgi:hypothetical protein